MKNMGYLFVIVLLLVIGCDHNKMPVEPQSLNQTKVNSLAKTTNVPGDYVSIQDAVDAAEPGDIILIKEGIYQELVKIHNKNNITIIGENALIIPPKDAKDPDINIDILESSNIKLSELKFDGRNETNEYPLYCAIGFTFSSGEASYNKIVGYSNGIACFNTNPSIGIPGEDLVLNISHNSISGITGAGVNLIGNFNVEIANNSIICSDRFFDNWWWFYGINMEGGTGRIFKNRVTIKKSSFLPETSVGIRLMMRNPADHNMGMMTYLHDVEVAQCIFKETDLGIKVNSYDELPASEEWCVRRVSLLNNKFVKVVDPYDINNECEEVVIK